MGNKNSISPSLLYVLKLGIILALVILFVGAAFLRVNNWVDSPLFYNSDTGRDYLIASHIAAYNEFPLVGPPSSAFPDFNTNILFYYILAAFLTIKNSLFFAGLANVFLQVLTIALVYILARKMFSLGTALIASLLFAFAHAVLVQSYFPWQPHFSQVFFALSSLLLLVSYNRKSYALVLLSIFLLIFSVALHNSVLSLVPLFMIVVFFILKRQKKGILHQVSALAVAVGSFFLLYIPTLIFLNKHNRELSSLMFNRDSYAMSLNMFFRNFLENTSSLIGQFFQQAGRDIFSLNIILILVVGACIPAYFLYYQKNKTRRIYAAVIGLAILQPILLSSILHTSQYHYFIVVYGLLIIFISEIIYTIFSKNLVARAAGTVLVVALLVVFSSNFYFLNVLPRSSQVFGALAVGALSSTAVDAVKVSPSLSRERQSMMDAMGAIEAEIHKIKYANSLGDLDFFQIRHYVNGTEEPIVDASFWVQLEKDFNKRFTKINDTIGFGYESINDDVYIILICNGYPILDDKECTDNFLRDHPHHLLENRFYFVDPFLMYVATSGQ